eukprot:jgi/Tetstr1/435496/TSEL_024401.t1
MFDLHRQVFNAKLQPGVTPTLPGPRAVQTTWRGAIVHVCASHARLKTRFRHSGMPKSKGGGLKGAAA